DYNIVLQEFFEASHQATNDARLLEIMSKTDGEVHRIHREFERLNGESRATAVGAAFTLGVGVLCAFMMQAPASAITAVAASAAPAMRYFNVRRDIAAQRDGEPFFFPWLLHKYLNRK